MGNMFRILKQNVKITMCEMDFWGYVDQFLYMFLFENESHLPYLLRVIGISAQITASHVTT